ncbi:YwqG family protein [Streptomyces sp. C36]|uniref:YwqG family protein n=1 Tax=Streptomyces sp. C36 TaxID=3237122 RepID=UPI0034C636C8
MTESFADAATLHDLARAHLPADAAERWIAGLRPAARLKAASGSDPVVGRLGSLPLLPDDVEWPVWDGHGPLAFVASLDCAALPSGALDIELPADGTLNFFYFDGQIDDGDALVNPGEPETLAGARIIYVPAGTPTAERAMPEDLLEGLVEDLEDVETYREVPLTAVIEATVSDSYDDTAFPEEFRNALWDLAGNACHRVGGHATAVQNPVDHEIAHAVLGGKVAWGEPAMEAEARRWTLLAQFDSDHRAQMMWGDTGCLYWLIRPEDLAERRFDRAMFTWQCC